jgi:hypothetical protein
MYYITLKSYTHHGGTKVNLNEIPEGTLIQRAVVMDDNPGMEYITVGFGDDGQFYLSAEVVENSPQYFEEIEEEDYWKEISKREIINACLLAEERGLEPLEAVQAISDHFDLDLDLDEWPEPNEKLRDASESFKKLMEEIERAKEAEKQKTTQPFAPYQPYPNPYNNQPYCQCGNDGTRPCWSTACPHRLIVTYCSTNTAGSFAGTTENHVCCKKSSKDGNKCC